MSWHGLIGICSTISGILAAVTSALPGHDAVYLAAAGFLIVGIDRMATAIETASRRKA